MFNLINTIKCYSNDNDRIKASERVGSYSVDYKDNIAQVIENKDAELDNIILTELYGLVVNGEHILYIGVE
jgi:hypothetical protein